MSATEAEAVAKALGGRKSGRSWLCRCPAHDDRSPSLSVATGRDGRLLLTCFAGCEATDILAELRRRGILENRERGDGPAGGRRRSTYRQGIDAFAPPPEPERPFLSAAARLWQDCLQIEAGTTAAAYLGHRGCALPHPEGDLRWHPALPHTDGHRGPALVALVTDAATGAPMTLHRTWLAVDGRGKAIIERPRLLWPGGRKKGGVVRLWPDDEVTTGLAVAEGIETSLTAARAFAPVLSLIDAGNLGALPVLDGIEALTIFADHDPAGLKAAEECAVRWAEAGCEVRIWRSPTAGEDLNDWSRP